MWGNTAAIQCVLKIITKVNSQLAQYKKNKIDRQFWQKNHNKKKHKKMEKNHVGNIVAIHSVL